MKPDRDTSAWEAAVNQSSLPATISSLPQMVAALQPFVNKSHVLLPGGGGMHMKGIGISRELECLDIAVSERAHYVVRPELLHFQKIPQALGESYFLTDLGPLRPSGVYEAVYREQEELVDLGNEYVERAVWDEGHLGYDEDENEIPFPPKLN